MTKVYDNATNLITFARGSSGTALRRVGYGDEIFGDPSFDGTGDWSLPGTSVTVSGGKLTYDAVSNVRGAEQNVNIYAGRVYQVSFEVLSGTARLYLSTGKFSTSLISDLGADNYGVGVHQINVAANGNYSTIGFTLSKFLGGTACELAYLSMKEVIFDRATDPLVLFNHPNDTPRIEYGSDGSLKGLLIEEQRTNLVTHSDFSSGWSEVRASLNTTTQAGPDGVASSSVKLVASTDNNSHFTTPGAVASGNYAVSVFAKAAEYSWLKLTVNDGGFPSSYFDLSGNGAIGAVSTGVTPHIESVGNGWFRCSVVNDTSITQAYVEVTTGDATSTFTGDGTSGIYLYGAQLEEGSFATSYIPTAGSQATRSADVASIPVSAFGYNQQAGTVVVEAVSNYLNSVGRTFTLSDGTAANRIQSVAYYNSHFAVDAGGTSQASLDAGSFTQGQYSRLGGAYATDNVAVVIDGGTVASDTSATMPTGVTTMTIGCRENQSSNFLNGHIKSIKYYPRRLTDAQLQELTS